MCFKHAVGRLPRPTAKNKCVGLCGLSSEYRARQEQLAQQRAAEIRARLNAEDDATCRGYGTTPGSDNYVACRMNIANNGQQVRNRCHCGSGQANRDAAMAAQGAAIGALS
jgi:hypothetical protein